MLYRASILNEHSGSAFFVTDEPCTNMRNAVCKLAYKNRISHIRIRRPAESEMKGAADYEKSNQKNISISPLPYSFFNCRGTDRRRCRRCLG